MAAAKKRLFMGIPLNEEWAIQTQDLQQNAPLSHEARWVKKENLHITLVFLGDTAEEQIPSLQEHMHGVIQQTASFSLRFEKFVLMPPHKPYMLWAQFFRHPAFARLACELAVPFQGAKVLKPIPHITLARFKPHPHQNFSVDPPLWQQLEMQVQKIHLYASTLTPKGPIYRIVDTFILP